LNLPVYLAISVTYHIWQISPFNWELIEKILIELKPFYLTKKATEGDYVFVSEVMPNIKKLDYAIRSISAISASEVGTLRSKLLAEMKRLL
jgi:hypothetical protein